MDIEMNLQSTTDMKSYSSKQQLWKRQVLLSWNLS